jgi:hypothetical protein
VRRSNDLDNDPNLLQRAVYSGYGYAVRMVGRHERNR